MATKAIATMTLEIQLTAIPEVKMVVPPRYRDERGFFSETYSRKAWAGAGLQLDFVQDNHSLSVARGVIRGLHFQIPPFAQDKLIHVVRGAAFDVAVDLRKSSPTFGKHVAAVLSAAEGNQFFIPKGFAHGFCTLEANTEVFYKVTNYYSRESDRGVLWDDPEIGIPWPVSRGEAILSDRDRRLPRFSELRDLFD